MRVRSPKRQVIAASALTALTVVACATLMTAAMLDHAPAAVLPLAVAICIGCPMGMAWSLARTVTALGSSSATPDADRAVRAMHKALARIPETEHPLGL